MLCDGTEHKEPPVVCIELAAMSDLTFEPHELLYSSESACLTTCLLTCLPYYQFDYLLVYLSSVSFGDF